MAAFVELTGHTPNYIVYGQELRLPYDLLEKNLNLLCIMWMTMENSFSSFSDIHREVKTRLQDSKTAIAVKQHRHASRVELQPGDSVMIQAPERRSKLSPKFEGPRLLLKRLHGNKSEVFDPVSNKVEVVHNDRLK